MVSAQPPLATKAAEGTLMLEKKTYPLTHATSRLLNADTVSSIEGAEGRIDRREHFWCLLRIQFGIDLDQTPEYCLPFTRVEPR